MSISVYQQSVSSIYEQHQCKRLLLTILLPHMTDSISLSDDHNRHVGKEASSQVMHCQTVNSETIFL